MKILIVEDDRVIAQALKQALNKWQLEAEIVTNFNHIVDDYVKPDIHLILLDINLPSFNGYYWCQEIRKVSNVPIIFISSRSDSMDKVMAIEMGGDDYIEKPFDMTVTISKIQALLRRTYDFNATSHHLDVQGCKLVVEEGKLYYDDQVIDLTFTELQIVHQLFKNEGQYVSRNKLIETCWESEHFIDDNTLAVNMTRLRKKLKSIGVQDLIQTKKNMGYKV
ncbi:response regulator transcription factor [Staphylococcus massiliensis]|uniref:Nisin susceptibility-associated DNA-binding response regulator n=1 Tax=Staphylococcus massiliensis S46 TaxID=1229783 RepID=K9AS40_9STAP|nr:response regulator transcription factor [Staphylococcus massiliensis]EKU50144.1 nisin susceptibility-associated DNA-binding response regulator [Staphylococcus massiliensis S46]MCG3400436.1 response regulator transcription factor [Staphylococcus massiliensis]MCG3402153.1 response regulator transcription factor [Staphylococcus massiliensis]MCG3412880.1 response regulator transcription factor [Staphylococcus massiliensis]POA00838.1 DNA-binding response regulator [Staphylococcus massiliensis CC